MIFVQIYRKSVLNVSLLYRKLGSIVAKFNNIEKGENSSNFFQRLIFYFSFPVSIVILFFDQSHDISLFFEPDSHSTSIK